MDAHEVLLEQSRHHYRWLESACADVDDDQAERRLAPGRPSIAWQVTHLIEQVESTAEALAGVDRPSAPVPSDWTLLRERFHSSATTALEALARLSADDLQRPPLVPIHAGFEAALRTRVQWWSGHVFHLAYHLGQVGSLRAELGLGWWSSESDCRQDPPTGS